jgi:ribonuclease
MKKSNNLIGFAVLVGIALLLMAIKRPVAQVERTSISPSATIAQDGFGQPHIGAVRGQVPILKDVSVIDFGRTVFRGDMDLNPTIDRIRRGKKLEHRNDGSFFGNRERRLPKGGDREFYREFVHKMKGISFPGPQRVIIGKDGSVWYTGDHYATFVQVSK